MNGTYLSGFTLDVGWMRHAVRAVIHRLCRQAHNKNDVVLLRNARWVTQKALTHPTQQLKLVPFNTNISSFQLVPDLVVGFQTFLSAVFTVDALAGETIMRSSA